MSLKKILCAIILLISPLQAELPSDDSKKISYIENYFNRMKTLKAQFTQTNPDGSKAAGIFYIKRPGRMRIQYKQPEKKLIIADGNFLIYNDPAMDEVSQMDLESSPANIILKENVSFSDGITVTDFSETEKGVQLTLTKSDDSEAGSLTLVFSKSPFVLSRWIIRDQQGANTFVNVSDVSLNKPLEDSLFVVRELRF